jgi:hypothetical protein
VDDHSDHDGAHNLPIVSSASPVNGKAATSFTLTIAGTNLTGASNVVFTKPGGSGDEQPDGESNDDRVADPAFTATKIQVNAGGTQLTATVSIAAAASPGVRIIRVVTPNGQSSGDSSKADIFTVTP